MSRGLSESSSICLSRSLRSIMSPRIERIKNSRATTISPIKIVTKIFAPERSPLSERAKKRQIFSIPTSVKNGMTEPERRTPVLKCHFAIKQWLAATIRNIGMNTEQAPYAFVKNFPSPKKKELCAALMPPKSKRTRSSDNEKKAAITKRKIPAI